VFFSVPMEIKDVLNTLGIEGKKADVYLMCLEKGGATAYEIAKIVGLKRPTVYDILYTLTKEGLVYLVPKKGVTYFYPSDPERILHQLKEKERVFVSALPRLHELYTSPKQKPNIRYFEGEEGIKTMYQDSLNSLTKKDEILLYCGEDILKYLPAYAAEYVAERVKKNIHVRGIYKKTPEVMQYMVNNEKELRQVKILEEKDFALNNEINIYKNKVAIASYGKEMFGMIIESDEISKAQRAIFELAWLGAENLK